MATRIEFTVLGKPATAGSKKAFALRRKDGSLVTRPNGAPVVNVTDDCKESRHWKQAVAWAARQKVGSGVELLRDALVVEMRFFRVRPKWHYRSGKKSHLLKPDAPPVPTNKPDVLKTARAIEDALTGVLWVDDAQIVDERLTKCWGEPERVEVVIRPWAQEKRGAA